MSYIGKDVAPQPQGTYSQSEIDTQMLTKVPKVTSTDNAVVRFDGTTGQVQNSGVSIDDSGNVGIGVTPSAWSSTWPSLQIKNASFTGTGAVADFAAMGANLVATGSAYPTDSTVKYISNGYATSYRQYAGTHLWFTAQSGTAGNAITWTNPMTLDASGNLKFNSGYGSAATAYGCRAWVNFNGTGTVAIRASGNISGIIDYSSGNYGIGFMTAMPDTYFSAICNASNTDANTSSGFVNSWNNGTTSCQIMTAGDALYISLAIFR